MKALSLKQPFAELIVSGKKTVEIRKWNTTFRGEFLVHASKTPDKKAMEKHEYTELTTGAIVGKVRLVEVKQYENKSDFECDANKHFATSDYGKYAFVLDDPQRVRPIKMKGMLGFWECEETFD